MRLTLSAAEFFSNAPELLLDLLSHSSTPTVTLSLHSHSNPKQLSLSHLSPGPHEPEITLLFNAPLDWLRTYLLDKGLSCDLRL